MCGHGTGHRGGGGEWREETNGKERGRKNGERRNGRRDKDEGGARVRRADNPNHRIRRMHPHGFAALRDRARPRTPAEPICPLPSTVAHLLE